jgi:signal transduction histidine kinase/CheY-like chemotaxis protein/PAS domain-containing protein
MNVRHGAGFLESGGEMAALIRSRDWSSTPIGPVESWSPSLRMMVGFLLANRFPLLLWWGSQYISLYNDAYRPVLGEKHPSSLGQPVKECWSEIWHVLKPLIDAPFEGGPPTWMDDLPLELNRHGFMEEAHFTVAYSPVPDDTASRGIGGVLATVHEITETVVGKRRIESLRELGASTGEARTAEEACTVAGQALGRHPKDIPFALLYLIDDAGQQARLVCTVGVEKEEPLSPGAIGLGPEADQPWPFREVLDGDEAVTVQALSGRFAKVPPGPWSDPPHAAVVVPIKSNIVHRLAGFLVAGVSPRLRLDEQYLGFIDLVAAQIATAVATARAYEQERRRAEALAELDRAKTMFFSNVSHEFRTPLTLMLGPLEDALAAPHLPAVERARLGLAHRNSLRLLKLVNSLLDFSRIEAGRMQVSYVPVDLARLTDELASNFRSACERVRLALVVDCSPLREPVHVDRDMWEKIVLNLLSNAFKFTFAGEITVRLREAGEQVELEVRDTGVGIPAAELPRLFERFHRIEGQKSRTYEGSGIGLALVQELVNLHGGTIRVESVEGRGASFIVTIPFGTAHLSADRIGAGRSLGSTSVRAAAYVEEALRWLAGDDTEIPEARRQLDGAATSTGFPGGMRILLADDNADMRAYVRSLLEPLCEVQTVPDGRTALETIRAARPDLVLADVMMPILDGFGLLRAVRADPLLCDIPVIMLSARAGEGSRVEGLDAGADDYLVKPFAARELIARVGAHLQIAQVRREATETLRISEERQAFLLRLSDGLRPLVDSRQIKEAASRLLGGHLGASRVTYFTATDEHYVVEGGYARGVPAGSGRYPALSFGPKILAAYRSGLAVWSDDVEGESGLTDGERAAFAGLEVRAYVGVPVMKAGVFVAGLAVHSQHPRRWTPEEVSLVEETAERTWAAVNHALAEDALRASELRFRSLVTASSDAVYRMSPDWSEMRQLVGRQFIVDTVDPSRNWLARYIHPEDQPAVMDAVEQAIRTGSVFELEHRVIQADGSLGWTHSRAVALLDADGATTEWIGTATDITRQRRDEQKGLAQRQILEMVATGQPLRQILDALLLFMEGQEQGMRCGLMLVDDDGTRLRRGSGPHLPEAYHQAFDGASIVQPYLGPCSEVVHRCACVLISDVAGESRYALEWRGLMEACGIGAASSTPVCGTEGRVLGSLAMYFDRARDPAPADAELVDMATHLAAIAIERHREREALQQRAAQLRQMVDELNHRVKNTLATVQSLASQSLRGASSAPEGRIVFEARLRALARAHDVLTREHWEGASLREVVAGAMSFYGSGRERSRVNSRGPEIRLRPKAAVAISMALHELATNAVKHGALSVERGQVVIGWQPTGEGDAHFRLEWRERDGPPVRRPTRRGFGSRLLEQGLAHDLAGEVQLIFDSSGLVCIIEAPLNEVGQREWRAAAN